jgi:hypothetical protein
MTSPDDLRSLPDVQPSRDLDDRVRRAAHAELSLAMGPRWRVIGTFAWTRVALPVGITVTVVGYLHWAVVAANALYR